MVPLVRRRRGGTATIFSAYTARKRKQHLLDLEDLLLYWRAAVRSDVGPAALVKCSTRSWWTSTRTPIWSRPTSCGPGRPRDRHHRGGRRRPGHLFVPGRHRPQHLGLPLPLPGSVHHTLEQNYRSTTPILELANAVIAAVGEGVPKQLWTDQGGGGRPSLATCPDQQAQATAVSQTILDHYESGIPLRNQVVLFRTGHHSDLVEVELRRRRIPFVKYGGLRFLEAAHVRDLLAMLRLVQNPFDEMAWLRVLQLVHGIGPASSTGSSATRGTAPPGTGPDPLAIFCAARRCGAAPRSAEDLPSWPPPSAPARDAVCRWPGRRSSRALDPMVRRHYDHPEGRLADFDALTRIAADAPNAHQPVADLTLDPPTSTGDLAGSPSLDDDWITLSTVHSAKGGEWGVVHVIHAADAAFPSDLATAAPKESTRNVVCSMWR